MEKLIDECLKKIPLNLRVCRFPYYDKNRQINGGEFEIIDIDKGLIVTKFKLVQMEGCNGIVISKNVAIYEGYKGKGYGSILCDLREQISAYMGYSAIMCTCVLGNLPQQKILAKNNWVIVSEFLNKKTNNLVRLYFKKL